MAIIKPEYGTSTAITATGLASLANNAAYDLGAVNNGTDKFRDAMVYLAFKLATGTPGNENAIYIYGYSSEDGTNFTDNSSGSAGAITLRSPTNLILLDRIEVPASGTGALTWRHVINGLAQKLGGKVLPRKWGLVIRNATNLAFDSTGSNHTVTYSGIYDTSS